MKKARPTTTPALPRVHLADVDARARAMETLRPLVELEARAAAAHTHAVRELALRTDTQDPLAADFLAREVRQIRQAIRRVFGAYLAKLRIAADLPRTELARRARVRRMRVFAFERYGQLLSPSQLARVTAVLGLDAATFIAEAIEAARPPPSEPSTPPPQSNDTSSSSEEPTP